MPEEADTNPLMIPQRAESERSSRGTAWVPINAIAIVVIVVMVLLLVRECGSGGAAGPNEGGTKTIEAVSGRDPVPGAVSIWVSDQTTLNDALSGAGVNADTYISVGRGRYLIEVPPGTESGAISALIEEHGVFDAGFVYEAPMDKFRR